MSYSGRITNGVVVFDEPVPLKEGTLVHIEAVTTYETKESKPIPSLAERLGPVIGKAKSLPEDAAENHDHYLYGCFDE